MIKFLRANLRWLSAGFLLTFTSAFGQTWFISLFAGAIKAEYGLSDGAWGGLYSIATLSAAGLLFCWGSAADTVPLSRLAPLMAGIFALASFGMMVASSVWLLGLALFLLRFCGQGMFSHIAMTAMGLGCVETPAPRRAFGPGGTLGVQAPIGFWERATGAEIAPMGAA